MLWKIWGESPFVEAGLFVCPLGRFGVGGFVRVAREVSEHAVEDLRRISVGGGDGLPQPLSSDGRKNQKRRSPIETSVLRSLPKGALSSGSDT